LLIITPGTAEDSLRDSVGQPDELEWRVHPFVENARGSVLLVAIILITLIAVWYWGYPGLVVLGALLLVVAMAPYFFPVRYHMTGRGVEIIFLGVRTFRGWEELRNFYPSDVGVHLSTFKRPNALDSFRGSFIRFAPGNREAVLRFLDAHIERTKPAESKPEE